MAVSKAQKTEALKKLKEVFKDSLSVVFVNFHGLSSNDANAVRKTLKENGVKYLVAKKTLTRKALEETKVPGDQPEFVGELGIAYGSDAIAPAREVYAFQKKLDNKIAILGGIFEGSFASKDSMVSIAEIPPLKTLHAQFVNLVNSPIQGFVMALDQISKKKA